MTTSFDSLQPHLIKQRKKAHEICRQFTRSPSKGNLSRLKSLFKSVGKTVFIEAGFYCDYGDKISIGERVYFNLNCTLLDGGSIEIGDDCLIGSYVQILTINHPMSAKARLNKTSLAGNIKIEKNVWIGSSALILPNTHIGQNAVIGAGSVVCHDIEENSLYAGNPAKKIRDLAIE